MSALALILTLLPQTATGGVQGVVLSAGSGEPVAYAEVRVMGDSVADWTDDAGRYRLDGLAAGEWRVRVMHPGHDSLDLAVVVPGDRDVRMDVLLEPVEGPAVDALADFTPFQVMYTLPALLNTEEIQDIIRRWYPADLVERGIGGETVLRIWLDEGGRVVRSRVSSSSGQATLDRIAVAVSDSMRFRPARSREDPVRVIVRMPVLFSVPDSARGGGGPSGEVPGPVRLRPRTP